MIESGTIEMMAGRVAFYVLAKKSRPEDEFKGKFWDIKQELNTLKDKRSEEAKKSLSKTLISDLKSKGIAIADFELSISKFKGHPYVGKAKFKAKMKDKESANKLLKYLQTRYSPKYKLKNVGEPDEKTGAVIAEYNVR